MFLTRIALFLALVTPVAAFSQTDPDSAFDRASLSFTPREMLYFDIEGYLETHAPQWSPYSEAIGHWSAYYMVSPRLLIALMELQDSTLREDGHSAGHSLDRPFGTLSAASGFRNQLIDVAEQLSVAYHGRADAKSKSKLNPVERKRQALELLLTDRPAAMAQLESAWARQFPQDFEPQRHSERQDGAEGSVPISLQMPWPVGESWRGGGAHSGNMQSLDFQGAYQEWGDPGIFDFWVSASSDGTVRVWSSCSVSVIDPSETWVTSYYHLENIAVNDQDSVTQNQALANYADDEEQAICQGGSSTGPHVHFSVSEDGVWEPIHNRVLSSFRINMESEEPYDSDCVLNFYDPINGDPKVCPWSPLGNSGAVVADTYVLSVNFGTGDGEYVEGAVVEIVANAPSEGMEFDQWTGDTGSLDDVNASTTDVTMPAAAVEVTATYQVIQTYSLVVNSGSGDGDYAEGAMVEIVADAPAEGMEFDQWTGDTGALANANASTTNVTMPAEAVEVTATYREVVAETWTLTVNNGSGDGDYEQGAVVNIEANPAEPGKVFDQWTGDTGALANMDDPTTTVTMPGEDVTVTATYVDIPPETWTLTVNGGTGDGEYTVGTVVNVAANAPAPGKVFAQWTGDSELLADANDPTTTLTMPAENVTITAFYTDAPTDAAVTGFMLVDALSNEDLFELEDKIYNLDDLPTRMSIRAIVNGAAISRVDFEWTHGTFTDSESPYLLEGDNGIGNIQEVPELSEEGIYEVWAQPVSPEQEVGQSHSVRFSFYRPVGLCGGQPCSSPGLDGLSGSWYDPDSSGEGFMIHGVQNNLAVAYFYGYGPTGQRLWLIATSEGPFRWDRPVIFDAFIVSGGTFTGFDPANITETPWGQISLILDDCGNATGFMSGQTGSKLLNLKRLGEVPGTGCSPDPLQSETNLFTGSWYDPATNGQGFAINKVSDDRGVVYFYGFQNSGVNLWLIGVWNRRPVLGRSFTLDMFQVSGGTWEEVDPANIVEEPWGTLRLNIEDCINATAELDGNDGMQTFDLEQLASTFPIGCP